jgi:hypothetical protein
LHSAYIRVARNSQVNIRVLPTIKESIGLVREIFREVYKNVPEKMKGEHN